jgi:hypothetical protein
MTKAEAVATRKRFWSAHVKQWQQSGLSQTAYCRQHGLKPTQLSYWKCRLLKPDPPVSLVQVNMQANVHSHQRPCTSPLRLVVGNQYRIEVERDFDPVALQQLLCTLERL